MRFLINLTEKIKAFYSFHRERKTLPPWVFVYFSKIFSFICFILRFISSKIKDSFLFHKERNTLIIFFLSLFWFFVALISVLASLFLLKYLLSGIISGFKQNGDLLSYFLYFLGLLFGLLFFIVPLMVPFLLIIFSIQLLKLSSHIFKTVLLLMPAIILAVPVSIPILLYVRNLVAFLLWLFVLTVSILTPILLWQKRNLLIGKRSLDIQQTYLLHKERKTLPMFFISIIFFILGLIFAIVYFGVFIWGAFVSQSYPPLEEREGFERGLFFLATIVLPFIASLSISNIWTALWLFFLERRALFFMIPSSLLLLLSLLPLFAFGSNSGKVGYNTCLILRYVIFLFVLVSNICLLSSWKKLDPRK